MGCCHLRHAQVVQIPPAQPSGVAECDAGDGEIRIVHVAPTPFGSEGLFGGGERYPLELARALSAHVDCRVVTFGPVARQVSAPGGPDIRVLRPFTHLRGHPAHPLAPGLLAAIDDADVIHTHHLRSTPSRLAALAGRVRGRRLVVTDHGLGGGGWGGLLPRLFDRFLTVSRYSAETLGVPPSRTRVIYGGADPQRYRPEPDEEERHGVLFVGRLTPHKGVDRLLRALPDGEHLTVVGTGGHDPHPPERDYPDLLRRLAADHDVTFRGQVSDAELPGLYRRAAVYVLPSVHETCYGRHVAISELLGLSVLEAMASGAPVVCSKVGGVTEIVRDGETGFLVEPGDIAALRDRLDLLLHKPDLARELGDNARTAVLERFTWDACARRCLDAYQQLMAAT
ncbi:MAG TPA: glycosyltransferase family 4 protein [Euzebyales bacterium]|nr:glycosyltransferase family 4 protein [Euzebyales bacterium]